MKIQMLVRKMLGHRLPDNYLLKVRRSYLRRKKRREKFTFPVFFLLVK